MSSASNKVGFDIFAKQGSSRRVTKLIDLLSTMDDWRWNSLCIGMRL